MPDKLYWEDIEVGKTISLGEKRVERDEIIAFAREFDPQPFHLDEQAAKDTMIGELIASGWHTNVMLMRLMYDNLLKDSASLGSGGLEEVKWLEAVRPGDVIRAHYICLESRGFQEPAGYRHLQGGLRRHQSGRQGGDGAAGSAISSAAAIGIASREPVL